MTIVNRAVCTLVLVAGILATGGCERKSDTEQPQQPEGDTASAKPAPQPSAEARLDVWRATTVELPRRTEHLGGFVQLLNAQLPAPWPGLHVGEGPGPFPWSFEGTYWEAMIALCRETNHRPAPFMDALRVDAAPQARFHTEGPTLITVKPVSMGDKAHIQVTTLLEPQLGGSFDTTVRVGDAELQGLDQEWSTSAGAIASSWPFELPNDAAGALSVEVKIEQTTGLAKLNVPIQKDAEADVRDVEVIVTDVSHGKGSDKIGVAPTSVDLLVTGGEVARIAVPDPTLSIRSHSSSRSGSTSRIRLGLNETPSSDAELQLSIVIDSEERTVSAKFDDIDWEEWAR